MAQTMLAMALINNVTFNIMCKKSLFSNTVQGIAKVYRALACNGWSRLIRKSLSIALIPPMAGVEKNQLLKKPTSSKGSSYA